MELALAGEAVLAVQVAGVSHVQAQRLDYAFAALLELARKRREAVFSEELSGILKIPHLFPDRSHFAGRVLVQKLRLDLLKSLELKAPYHLVRQIVHRVDRAGHRIEHYIVTA